MILPGASIAVTGASGFIGRYLLADLREAGFHPVAIGRGAEADRQTDYSPESLRAALSGTAAVVHLAGRRMTREDEPMDPEPFFGPNIETVGHLARAAQAEGLTRIIFASTIAVYSAVTPAPYREDGPTHPVNAYALSKLMAEALLAMLARARQAPPALSLRFAAVYGHGEKGTPALMKFVNQAAAGERLVLSGNSDYTIDQLYVRDATAAIIAALRAPAGAAGSCNIGGGRAWSVADIARAANEVCGNVGNIDDSAATPSPAHQAVMDISHAAALLYWRPAHDLNSGLKELHRLRTADNHLTSMTNPHYHFIDCPTSERLIIFFTATGAAPGAFNFWQAAEDISTDTNVLLVNGWSNTWYQDGVRGLGGNMEETLQSIRSYCTERGITQIFCSGQSMGGYGALLFAGLLGGKAIAFGAETVLDLPHSQYSRKANRTVPVRYGSLPETFANGLNAVLLAGERDPVDIYCAKQLQGLPGVSIKTMRFVGHGPAGYLRNRKRLVPFLRLMMAGKPLPKMSEDGSALVRPGFPEVFYAGWCAIRDKDFELARKNLEQAVSLYPGCDEARFLLGKALDGLKNFDAALVHYSIAYTLTTRKDALLGTANCLRRTGQLVEAKHVYYKLLSNWPEEASAHYSLGLCYLALKDKRGAFPHFEQAVALAPQNLSYANRLILVRNAITD